MAEPKQFETNADQGFFTRHLWSRLGQLWDYMNDKTVGDIAKGRQRWKSRQDYLAQNYGDSGNRAYNLKRYTPWEKDDKTRVEKYGIPLSWLNEKGGIKSGVNPQDPQQRTYSQLYREKYKNWKADAEKQGYKADPKYWLYMSQHPGEKQKLQSGTNTDILPIMQGRLQVWNTRRQLQDALKNAPDDATRKQLHQQLLQLGQYKQQLDEQYKNLPAIDKYRYYTSPMAVAAALPAAATLSVTPAGAKAIGSMVTYGMAPTLAQKGVQHIRKGDNTIARAFMGSDLQSIPQEYKGLLQEYQQKYNLPAFDPNNENIVKQYQKAGLDIQNTTSKYSDWAQRGIQAGSWVLPFAKTRSLAGKLFGGVMGGKQLFTPSETNKSIQKAVLTNDFRNAPVTAQQYEAVKKQLEQQGITPSVKNVVSALYNRKTEQDVASSWAPSLYNIPGVKSWMKSKTESGIQDSLKQLQEFGSLSPQEQQKALPKLLQQMRGFYKDSTSQAAALAYLDDPDNQQALTGMFDKMSPQQLSSLMNGYTALSEKGPKSLPASVTLIGNALQNAAQNSAAARFQKGLSQQDPQKFEAHMKEWLPLFSKFKGQDGKYDALKDKAHKAVWEHVKKNPLFINKAMSFWAMQNGYNNLASFLGSNGAFYGTLVGLPLTIALVSSLFGGSKQAPQQVPQQQYYQPMAYAPRGITERGLIVG